MKLDTIIRGDVLTTLAEIPNASIDLIITSPPYNIASKLKRKTYDKTSNWHPKLGDGYTGYSDDMDQPTYEKWQNTVLHECWRVLNDKGAIFYNHKKMIRGGIMQKHDAILDGLPLRQEIIWDRGSGNNFELSFFTPSYESVYLLAKPDFKRRTGFSIRDVMRINMEHGNPHPAPFPVELPRQIINATDAKIILDPFMGSGSTAVAAIRAGRHYLGIEQSPKYVKQAMMRIRNTKPDSVQRVLN